MASRMTKTEEKYLVVIEQLSKLGYPPRNVYQYADTKEEAVEIILKWKYPMRSARIFKEVR